MPTLGHPDKPTFMEALAAELRTTHARRAPALFVVTITDPGRTPRSRPIVSRYAVLANDAEHAVETLREGHPSAFVYESPLTVERLDQPWHRLP